MDVFFVRSGFLITGLLVDEARRRHHVSLPGFCLRRARRILLAALLTLLVTDIVADKLLNIVRAQQYLRDSIPSALFGANADTRTTDEESQTAQAAELAQGEHIGFLDATGWFCYREQCPLVIGNVIAYRDAGHVSATYAQALSAVFDAALSATISGPTNRGPAARQSGRPRKLRRFRGARRPPHTRSSDR